MGKIPEGLAKFLAGKKKGVKVEKKTKVVKSPKGKESKTEMKFGESKKPSAKAKAFVKRVGMKK